MSRHYTGPDRQQLTAWTCPTCGEANARPITEGCQSCGAGRPRGGSTPRQEKEPTMADPNAPIDDGEPPDRAVPAAAEADAADAAAVPTPPAAPAAPDRLAMIEQGLAQLMAEIVALKAAPEPVPEPEPEPEPVQPLTLYVKAEGDYKMLDATLARTITYALLRYAQTPEEAGQDDMLGVDATVTLVTALTMGHGLA